MRSLCLRAVALAVMMFTAGCTSSVGPEIDGLAMIAIPGYEPLVEIEPGGSTALVRVRTIGSSCVRKGTTHVEIDGMQAEIVPYNRSVPGGPCRRDIKVIVHEVALQFGASGTATIAVTGIDARQVPSPGDTLRIERVIQVD